MRKVWTTLIMFSLFFLFSFSYAGTVTINGDSYDCPEISDTTIDCEFEDYIFVRYDNAYYTGSYYELYFLDSSNSNYSNLAILGKQASHVINNIQYYRYYFLKTTNGTNYSLISSPKLSGYKFIFHAKNNYAFTNNFVMQDFDYELLSFGNNIEFLHCDYPGYELVGSSNWTLGDLVYEPGSNNIVMQNPLSDAEIKSILEIFLESVRNSDLPEHYGRYVLTYNNITGRYTGFVYPSYVNIGLKYCDFDENEKFYYVENSVGSYYFFVEHSEDTNYISQFLSALELGIKNPMLYEFKSNSDNTFFRFTNTYDFGTGYEDSFVLSTVDEPIIYTSHKLYSLFLTGTDIFGFGQYEVDEDTSIDNQIFTDSETGESFNNTLNDYTEEEENSDVNILSFIVLFFGFIFSLVSFVIRFFGFLVNFVFVPASTNILPPEFVQGIDWVHSFAFGDILLMDIFSIAFLVLLSIYLINLIREL